MANPIPLMHAGVVRAWMCAICHNVHAHDAGLDIEHSDDEVIPANEWSSKVWTYGELRADRIARRRESAARCCQCRGCGRDLSVPRAFGLRSICARCVALDRWSRFVGDLCCEIVRSALPPSRAPAPVVPLPPDEAWRQGGDGGRGNATWRIVAGMSELSEDIYCATWMSGCEYLIWSVGSGSASETFDMMDSVRCEVLVESAKEHDVWWYFRSPIKSADQRDPMHEDPNDYRGPWPVRLATWAKMWAAAEAVRRV